MLPFQRQPIIAALTLMLLSGAIPAVAEEDAVRRGEYLVRAGGCFSCHTVAGEEKLAGGRALALSRKPGQKPAAYWIVCRHGSGLLPPPSLPARDHPARDLALSPLHPELPRCLGTAGRTRARHVLRNGAAMGAEVRSRDRATAAPASPSAER